MVLASRWARVSPTQRMGIMSCAKAARELAVYEIVILSEEGTTLRVADDDIVAEACEHSRGDFAGECAFGLGVEVLGAELECRAGYLAADCREGYEGRDRGELPRRARRSGSRRGRWRGRGLRRRWCSFSSCRRLGGVGWGSCGVLLQENYQDLSMSRITLTLALFHRGRGDGTPSPDSSRASE